MIDIDARALMDVRNDFDFAVGFPDGFADARDCHGQGIGDFAARARAGDAEVIDDGRGETTHGRLFSLPI